MSVLLVYNIILLTVGSHYELSVLSMLLLVIGFQKQVSIEGWVSGISSTQFFWNVLTLQSLWCTTNVNEQFQCSGILVSLLSLNVKYCILHFGL